MAGLVEDSPVTYEDLAQLEKEFEDVETEIIRAQVRLSGALYAKRQRLIAQICNFWPLALEQAPPDIDEYIQPSDAAVLFSDLTGLTVTRFEAEGPDFAPLDDKEGGGGGDPRSLAFRFEFAENDHFEDRVLEKRFWHRRSRTGWAGLVSEPVAIRWKEGKDLTGGLLRMVREHWEAEQRQRKEKEEEGRAATDSVKGGDKEKDGEDDQQQKKESGRRGRKEDRQTDRDLALSRKIKATSLGGLSFFAWFGFRGKRVSAEESRLATEKALRGEKDGEGGGDVDVDVGDDDDDDDEDDELEIFPGGDELAVTLAEDLWPNAIKYFTQAQEQASDDGSNFESDEEDGDEDEEDGGSAKAEAREERPTKKRRA